MISIGKNKKERKSAEIKKVYLNRTLNSKERLLK